MAVLAPVIKFFRSILYILFKIREAIEHVFIVWPIEFLLRLWYRLDPNIYLPSRRILAVHDGIPSKGSKFAVFVLFARNSLPEFTENAIDAITRSDLNLVVVANGKLDAPVRRALEGKCFQIIERRNIGRDFGAYQDGVLHITSRYPDVDRIVLLNDSVYYLKGAALDRFFADLSGPGEFIGALENHEFRYHIQSFALSFGRSVIQHSAFSRFWNSYKPIGTRRWAIHRGEIRLTREIAKAGYRPHILFQAAHLVPILDRMSAKEVVEAVRLLPIGARDDLFYEFMPFLSDTGSLLYMRAISGGIRRLYSSPLRPEGTFSRLGVEAAALEQWSAGILPTLIVQTISEHNQTHFGGFLFMKFLNLPIMKRDLFNREIQTLEDVYSFLSSMGEPLRDEVMSDMRRAGSGANLRGLARILHRNGSI